MRSEKNWGLSDMNCNQWTEVKLDDIANITMGQSPSGDTCNSIGVGIPLLNGPTEFGTSHPRPVQFSTAVKKVCDIDDILFCVRGSTTGKMNWADQQYAIGRGLASIKHKNGKEYQHFLKGVIEYKLDEILLSATGSTFPNVSKDLLSSIQVLIPPLSEQKKISSVLSCIVEKIEINNRINHNLAQQAQALFSFYYADADRVVPFTEAIKVLGGGTPKTGTPDYWNGEIPFFTPKDVGTPYALTTEKTITEIGLVKCNSRLYPTNTIFVTARGTVGKISLAGAPMAMNQSCYALVPKGTLGNYSAYHITLSAVKSLKNKANGAVFDAIVTRDFETETVLIPNDERVVEFENAVTPIYETILLNAKENLSLAELRDTLLPKLMSGEIDASKLAI